MTHQDFTELLWHKARELYRDMPWRNDTRPYYVLVSELMLQQTQVDRVIPKFQAFVARFPDEKVLAEAPLADVLRQWQGLGYNRRARYLHQAAKAIVQLGEFPSDQEGLMALSGVGKNTAGAIMTYAYNQPVLFIETNVRAVYIHHFFASSDQVDDKDIQLQLEQTIDHENPRQFYWALMDYGSWLKKQGIKPSRSRHYKKQAPLKGSTREVRGQIVAALSRTDMTDQELRHMLDADHRYQQAVEGLVKDGLVTVRNDRLHLTK